MDQRLGCPQSPQKRVFPMRLRPTKESRLRELHEELHWLEAKGMSHLKGALSRMASLSDQHRLQVDAFCAYFGLDDDPKTAREVGEMMQKSASLVARNKRVVLRRLKHPSWKDESRWPEPVIRKGLSTLHVTQINDIAMRLHMQRHQQVGARQFMVDLQEAGIALGIPDADMLQFYTAINDRLMQRK